MNKKPYCDVLEYQFVGMKTDDSSTITIPWKKNATAENKNTESSTNPKSTFEKRVAAAHETISQSASPSTTAKRKTTPARAPLVHCPLAYRAPPASQVRYWHALFMLVDVSGLATDAGLELTWGVCSAKTCLIGERSFEPPAIGSLGGSEDHDIGSLAG
jgi:hypothetical protein